MSNPAISNHGKQCVAILSLASYVPGNATSNAELAQSIDTSDSWIASHTGIRQRYIAPKGVAASDLGFVAAQKVLQQSTVAPEEIDLIILASSTPDFNSFPATACVLQQKLGCDNAAAFDITAACSGFVYALEVARSMLLAHSNYNKVLVIGAEVFSNIINWQDRSTAVLFGDGAGAALLSCDDSAILLLDTLLKSDGSGAEKLWVPDGGSRNPINYTDSAGAPRCFVEMDGRAVYDFAVSANQEILHEILARNQLQVSDLRYIVPHQANLRIIQAVAKREKIPMDLFFTNIDRYANTSAASIPIALTELAQSELLQAGDRLLCIGFGAGLTYAGALLQWGSNL